MYNEKMKYLFEFKWLLQEILKQEWTESTKKEIEERIILITSEIRKEAENEKLYTLERIR